jgi:hypothetical protein
MNEKKIDNFRGKYFFLSNFYERRVICFGFVFRNTESAFQAMKCPERMKEFCGLSASAAKVLGRTVQLRPNWEQVKEDVMYGVCYAKFSQNKDLEQRLINTGDAELIEGNDWNDTTWGVCNGIGENKLGKILMRLRLTLRGNNASN